MADKIISRPSNQAYRDGWDRIFDSPMHTNVQDKINGKSEKCSHCYIDDKCIYCGDK